LAQGIRLAGRMEKREYLRLLGDIREILIPENLVETNP
jgi:hypothetical protein